MALSHSPQIVTDGLVFYYDMGNQQKSWKGAPTTNLATTQTLVNHSLVTLPIFSEAPEKGTGWKKAIVTATSSNFRMLKMAVFNVAANSTHTYSIEFECNSPEVYLNIDGTGFGGGPWTKIGPTRYSRVVTTATAGSAYLFINSNNLNASVNYIIYYKEYQIEQQSFATPFVNGTRTNTQAILDLTNNNTVTANSLTYATDGTFSFNGSSNTITIPKPIVSNTPYSVTQWVRAGVSLPDTTNSASRKTPLVGPGPIWNPGYWLTGRVFRVHANTEYRDVTINWVNDLTWHQIGQIFDGTTCYTIIDGQIMLGTRTAYSPPTTTTILIGSEITAGNVQSWNGDIGVTQFYGKALTATEVQQNFNALRGRYGV